MRKEKKAPAIDPRCCQLSGSSVCCSFRSMGSLSRGFLPHENMMSF